MDSPVPSPSTPAMRILYMTPYYRPVIGGAELHVEALADRLAARGHQVSVFTLRTADPVSNAPDLSLAEEEDIGLVRVVRFVPDERLAAWFNRFLERRGSWRLSQIVLAPDQIRMLAQGPLLTQPLRRAFRSRPDIITTVNWGFAAFPMPFYLARHLLRVPLVGMPLLHTEILWTRSTATAAMIDQSDAILANTEHEAWFCQSHGYPAERMHVCGVGIDPAAFSPPEGRRLRARLGLGEGPVVAYVGRMQVDKGVPLLVEAMRRVWKSEARARLLLAGRAQPEGTRDDQAFRAALAALDPVERARVVHVDGFPLEQKASIFDACDVYAMPSVSDSFGVTFLEAWFFGRPVIGARIPALEYVIDHGVDGLLVEPRNASALADAILGLLADPRRREAMALAGRAKVLARFTWDQVTDRVEAAYRTTLGQGRLATRGRYRRTR